MEGVAKKSAQIALDAVVVSFGLLLLACLSWCYMSLSSSPVQRGSSVSFAKVSVIQGRVKPETKQLAVAVCEKADFYSQNCYQGREWYMHSNSWCYVSFYVCIPFKHRRSSNIQILSIVVLIKLSCIKLPFE